MADKEYIDDAPRLIIRSYIRDNMSVTEVEDNGPGLSEEARKRVFEPFSPLKGPEKGQDLACQCHIYCRQAAWRFDGSLLGAGGVDSICDQYSR